jgi:transcription elongation factor Elf1
MKISYDDISEEQRWVFTCPKCKELAESYDDPTSTDNIECEHCGETFELEY